jgi:hypothetical protein
VPFSKPKRVELPVCTNARGMISSSTNVLEGADVETETRRLLTGLLFLIETDGRDAIEG